MYSLLLFLVNLNNSLFHSDSFHNFIDISYPSIIKMKNTIKYFLLLFTLNSNFLVSAQEEIIEPPKSKITYTVGIQYNPYLNRNLFSYDTRENVYAIRYGLGYNGITIGLELFGHTFKYPYKGNTIGLGIYSRYTFLRTKRVKPFAELSGFYSKSKGIIVEESLIQNGNDQITNSRKGYYLAPGLSIKLYKSKVSLDLMLKMSTADLINGTHFIPSYKINYHF